VHFNEFFTLSFITFAWQYFKTQIMDEIEYTFQFINRLSYFTVYFEPFYQGCEKSGTLFTKDNKYILTCNLSHTFDDFVSRLKNQFFSFRNIVEDKIHECDTKGDYLFFLTNCLIGIRSLRQLIHIENRPDKTYYRHSNFGIAAFPSSIELGIPVEYSLIENYIQGITEDTFSDHIFAIKSIIDEADFYLEKLITILQNTTSSDLQLRPNIHTNYGISTFADPLMYFDNLITYGGLENFKQKFISDATSENSAFYPFVLSYSFELEYFEIHPKYLDGNIDSGDLLVVKFADRLRDSLRKESSLSAYLIDQLIIKQGSNESEIKMFVNRLYNQIIFLLNTVSIDERFSKYPDITQALVAIEKRITGKYSSFLDPKLITPLDAPLERLIWNGSPTDFIGIFSRLIGKTITLDGNMDLEPVYKKIASFFYVISNKSGKGKNKEDSNSPYIKDSTVIQYFRDAHTNPKK
jgi:hypothetical protein